MNLNVMLDIHLDGNLFQVRVQDLKTKSVQKQEVDKPEGSALHPERLTVMSHGDRFNDLSSPLLIKHIRKLETVSQW